MRRVVHAQALHTRPSPRLSTGLLSVAVDGGVVGGDGSRFLARAITCASSASTVICARNTRVRGRHVRRLCRQVRERATHRIFKSVEPPCMIVAFRASPHRWTLLPPSGAPVRGQAAPSTGYVWMLKGSFRAGQRHGSRPQCGHLAGRQLSPRCPTGGRCCFRPERPSGGGWHGPAVSLAFTRCPFSPCIASKSASFCSGNCGATALVRYCGGAAANFQGLRSR